MPNTFVCIATPSEQQPIRVAALCKARTHNIASVDWLIGALGGDAVRLRLNDFQPSDMICCTPELERKFQQRFDVYGDSYVVQLDEGNLRRIIDQMNIDVSFPIKRLQITITHFLNSRPFPLPHAPKSTSSSNNLIPPNREISFDWPPLILVTQSHRGCVQFSNGMAVEQSMIGPPC